MTGGPERPRPSRPRLPRLGESLRFYVEDTLRARLRSPGVERYRRREGQGVRLLLAVGAIGAALLALWWLGVRR